MVTVDGIQPSDSTDEADLIRAVQRGEIERFAELVELHLDHIRGFIALKLPFPHLVNEIAHETFVFGYRRIEEFAPGTSFRGWLRAIALNLIRAELQRFHRQQSNELNLARQQLLQTDAFHASSTQPNRLEALEECLAELPPAFRELIDLKYTQQLPIEQIAHRHQRTETAVWQSLFRLRQQLKLCIEGKMQTIRQA
ncbi:MAG: sigma-70 family RNA polymerase sigma factor [Verrucomicrobiota bacterium]